MTGVHLITLHIQSQGVQSDPNRDREKWFKEGKYSENREGDSERDGEESESDRESNHDYRWRLQMTDRLCCIISLK